MASRSPYIYNYSYLKNREKSVYQIAGKNLSKGYSYKFLKILAVCLTISLTIGYLISLTPKLIGLEPVNFLNFLKIDTFNATYCVIVFVAGIGTAKLLYKPYHGYRVYEFLIEHFRPKHTYEVNVGKRQLVEKTYTNAEYDVLFDKPI